MIGHNNQINATFDEGVKFPVLGLRKKNYPQLSQGNRHR